MDRTFEFNIRQHVYSLPGMITDASKAIVHESWALAEKINFSAYHKIVLVCDRDYFSAAVSVAPSLQSATGVYVEILQAQEVLSLSRDTNKPASEYQDSLVFYLFPMLSAPSMAVMDYLRLQGAYIICVTNHQLPHDFKHADTVMVLTIPPMRTNLPIRNYTLAVLVFLVLARAIDVKNHGAGKTIRTVLIDEIKKEAFQLAHAINDIDSAILNFVHGISIDSDITFIGENTDYASACLSDHYCSQYLHRTSQLIDGDYTTNELSLSTDSCAILFTSIRNPAHSKSKSVICANTIPVKNVCVVTDDHSITGSNRCSVIHTPPTSKDYSQLFHAIVPALLIKYLFP